VIWIKPDGTRFVLAYHSPAEWADACLARLLALGCSETYARRVTSQYRQATLWVAKDD
jgi:hypothetical protein